MRLIRSLALAGALSCAAPMALLAPQAVASSETEAWAPETFTLENGMEVIVLPDHRAPVVTHMVWYRVGAADELPGKSGIAHLFEHLMFKATDDIPAGEFSKIVARNGGQDNAFTSWDYTAYYQRVAVDRLETMMEMEAERMTDLILSEDQVLPERDVVVEERRQRIENNPGAILFEMMMDELFEGHPYEISIIGYMDEVTQLTLQDANDFYGYWYGPQNAILVVAGDITAAELRPLAEDIYGSIEPTADLEERVWPEVQPLTESMTLTHSDPKVRQEEWDQYWQSTSYSVNTETLEPHALDLAAQILGGGRTSRLYQELVEEQGVAVSAYAFSWTDLRATGLFGMGASPAMGVDLETVSEAAHAVLADFIENGPTEEELARAQSSMIASSIFQRDNQASMAQLYGSAAARGDDLDRIATWPQEIESVTPEMVREALARYIADQPSIQTQLLVPEES
ncbi:pitrilysin family protein [Ponticaulis sp.]|uniref:M16 family metallopeptidase n=1 Tax=Ponticaulis sp. TaxID=2020902 RepID=UPI000B69F3D4|nr:pitrilysin family protein [Ponticaulis sp.]MAJ08686.1 peptidase M16 [Ponticaulis sp.]RPG17391.1 MAG: insulinase family protein [Hyphomonadaceae bacterium TMED125]HBH90025.1 insulinase family protein [Hyphomonadaceae bacterium]HBJ94182.1 insulinase family protein [Hyphomonadaceae bacterium]